MKISIIALFLMFSFFSVAQSDSVVIETYDIVYLKKGDIIKGQIISFDPSDGDITMVSEDGRKYFLTSNDYSSFKEDIPAKKKKRAKDEPFVLNDRKESEFELSLGFSLPFQNGFAEANIENDLYYGANFYNSPLSLNFGFGKYFNRKHFTGLNVDFTGSSAKSLSYSVAGRYSHQYDAYKRNIAFYIPIDLAYGYFRNNFNLTYNNFENDTTFNGEPYVENRPSTEDFDYSVGYVGLTLGHGIQFILKSKNSIAIEIAYMKAFVISQQNYTDNTKAPLDIELGGVKFSLKYNF